MVSFVYIFRISEESRHGLTHPAHLARINFREIQRKV